MNAKTVMMDITKLEGAAYNPRSISASMLEKLKKGLTEFGCVQQIVVNTATASKKGNATIVGGHQRVAAAIALGWTEIPTVDINEPSVLKEKALNLALNKLSGEWEFGKLGDMLAELSDGDFDVELAGFDALEIKELDGINDSLGDAFKGFEPAATATPPDAFQSFDEEIKTDYCCPKCAYEWSGKPR